jgi:hypothetical protein
MNALTRWQQKWDPFRWDPFKEMEELQGRLSSLLGRSLNRPESKQEETMTIAE